MYVQKRHIIVAHFAYACHKMSHMCVTEYSVKRVRMWICWMHMFDQKQHMLVAHICAA